MAHRSICSRGFTEVGTEGRSKMANAAFVYEQVEQLSKDGGRALTNGGSVRSEYLLVSGGEAGRVVPYRQGRK
jgi:hypothetical protein